MNQHLCRHLRYKSMFVPAESQGAPEDSDEFVNSSPPCWCNCTQCEVGPDDRPVGVQVCHNKRSCYEE
jgi:hypothetical protein